MGYSLRKSLRDLPRHESILRLANRLRRSINQCDVGSLEGDQLRHFLDDFQFRLAEIDRAIHGTYFEFKKNSRINVSAKLKNA